MQNIWEQLPEENIEQYGYFQKFLKLENRTLQNLAEQTGKGVSALKKYSANYNWVNRAQAYDEYNTAAGVSDSVPNGDTTPPVEDVQELQEINSYVVTDDAGESFALSSDNATETTTTSSATATTALTVSETTTPTKTLEELAEAYQYEVNQSNLHWRQSFFHYVASGKILIEVKERLKNTRGAFTNWLKENFPSSRSSAYDRLRLAEWCKDLTQEEIKELSLKLSPSHLLAMTNLTPEEVFGFIEEKAAQGVIVEDMTTRTLREEVKNLQQDLTDANKEIENLKAYSSGVDKQLHVVQNGYKEQEKKAETVRQDLEDAKKEIETKDAKYAELQKTVEELKNTPPVEVIKTQDVVPADYESNKQTVKEQKERISELQSQVNSATTDANAAKAKLTEMESKQADAVKRAEVFAKLNTISDLLVGLDDSAQTFIQEYATENPQKFQQICKYFLIDNNQ